MLPNIVDYVQKDLAKQYTRSALRTLICLWAMLLVILAYLIDDVWFLAGLLAYEILP